MIVVFEGIDGVGKTTQASLLSERLTQEGQRVVVTGPFLTEFGGAIRTLYLSGVGSRLHPSAEALILASAATQMASELVAATGTDVVILDRFVYSTLVYQGIGRDVGLTTVRQYFAAALDMCYPDVVIWLDVPPEIALARVAEASRDRLDKMPLDYHITAREGYARLARENPEFVRVDGTLSAEGVHSEIWAQITD